jgi:hypothetical protein
LKSSSNFRYVRAIAPPQSDVSTLRGQTHRLRAERRIAVVKLGKHIRIDSNDLDAYITASRQEPDDRAC